MRRVLVLAYHFPPTGGAGVQRSVAFVRHLRDVGYEPVVVTGPAARAGRWTPEDESLAAGIPEKTTVLRVSGAPPAPSSGMRSRAELWLGVADPFVRWWVDGATEAGARERVDLVYASMSPFESGVAAARLGRRLGVPWVADLRDPWALDEMQAYPTRLHRRLECRRMQSVLAGADAIVMNTDEASRLVRSFPRLARKPVFTVTNGFDPEDFAGPAPEREDDVFRIVHTGFLHTQRRRSPTARLARRVLGGEVKAVAAGTRSHVLLLRALERLVSEDPSLAGRIELHLAGALSETDRQAAAGSPFVREHGYLPHQETVELMRSADLLFLPMHDLPRGRRASIVPGKTYEYLASGRPILAAVPDGDARELLARAGTAFLCRPRDVDCMTKVLAAEVARTQAGTPPRTLRSGVLVPYERRNLTGLLAGVFDSVLGSDRTAASRVGMPLTRGTARSSTPA